MKYQIMGVTYHTNTEDNINEIKKKKLVIQSL